MQIWQGIILGLVQGITEFLPVSSSGHLVIAQQLFAFDHPPIIFDTLLHVSTLAAVLIYFRKKILSLNFQEIIQIIIGTIPAAIAGFLIKPFLGEIFDSLRFVSIGLLITGIIMVLTKNIKQGTLENTTPKSSLTIGIFQALAILPGISRSGSTVFGALILGLKPKKAFEFSFLLSIPAILGALVLQLDEIQAFSLEPSHALGMLMAFISGLVSVKILDVLIKDRKLHFFGYYCLIIGSLVLLTTK